MRSQRYVTQGEKWDCKRCVQTVHRSQHDLGCPPKILFFQFSLIFSAIVCSSAAVAFLLPEMIK